MIVSGNCLVYLVYLVYLAAARLEQGDRSAHPSRMGVQNLNNPGQITGFCAGEKCFLTNRPTRKSINF